MLNSLALTLSFVAFVLWSAPDDDRLKDGSPLDYPAAPIVDAGDVFHGVEFKDPYRWLEKMTSGETQKWVRAQEALLHDYVRDHPLRLSIEKRLEVLGEAEGPPLPTPRGDVWFHLHEPEGRDENALYVQCDRSSEAKVLVDPNTGTGIPVEIDGFNPNPQGTIVAYELNESRHSTFHFIDVTTQESLDDLIRDAYRVQRLQWLPGGDEFVYMSLDTEALGNAKRSGSHIGKAILRRHKLGTPQEDDVVVFEDDPNGAELLQFHVDSNGRYLVLQMSDDGGLTQYIAFRDLEDLKSPTHRLPQEIECKSSFVGDAGSTLWIYTDAGAPRGRILAVDAASSSNAAHELIAECEETIAGGSLVGGNAMGVYGGHLVLLYYRDGQPLIRVFDSDGTLKHEVEHDEVGMIYSGFRGTQDADNVLYSFSSAKEPSPIYSLNVETGVTERVLEPSNLGYDPDEYESIHVIVENDGVRIPMTITHHADVEPDGIAAAWMYGYGAYQWAAFAWHQEHVLAWLELGGVYVMPGIRGGGEHGTEWARDGRCQNRQNAIDDFIACGEWLTENGYCARGKLVADGWSASGALAASAAIQAPDLFGVALVGLPTLDLVRAREFRSISPTWLREYGCLENKGDVEALAKFSPYHNLNGSIRLPAILSWAGGEDSGSPPLHAYKFTAAAQAAQAGDAPIMLQLLRGCGHSYGRNDEQRIQTWADHIVFVLKALGIDKA